MRWLIVVTASLLLVLMGASRSGETTTPEPVQVPVLLYHHLEPGAGDANGAVVAVAEFAAQMAWLKANGFTAITTAELAAWLAGQGSLPPRPVLITFDDGYRSNYEHAFPILERHGLRATIFLVTGNLGPGASGKPKLTWEQIRTMEASGLIEFQAHTHDGHRKVAERPVLLAWTATELQHDTDQLRAAFAEHGVKQPTALAYPFGAYDQQAALALGQQGFATGFTVESGFVRAGDPAMTLKRLVIFPGTEICRFAEIVTGAPSCPAGTTKALIK